MSAARGTRRPARRPARRAPRGSSGRGRRARRRGGWRRRAAVGAAVVAAGIGGGVLIGLQGSLDDVIKELTLPLRHEDVIRQEAAQHGVQPELVAAVIYAESRFRDQTSSAGARGLMQITPQTAREIERRSGGTTFELRDLGDPDVNIAYGTFLLAELLQRYDGNEAAALAAYNAGPSHVDRWGGAGLELEEIGFPETRSFVEDVLEKRQDYRRKYGEELGY